MKKHVLIALTLITLSSPAFAGIDEGRAAYDKKDWVTAIKELRPLAEAGDDRAMILLANMYSSGFGVIPSHKEALTLYRRAATEKNNPMAMDAMGAAYVSAIGVDQNLHTALEWFQRSASLGDQVGAFFYATILSEGNKTPPNELKPDLYNAYKWFKIAAAEKQIAKFSSSAQRIADGISSKKMLPEDQLAKADAEAAAFKPVEAKDLGPAPVEPPQAAQTPVPVDPTAAVKKDEAVPAPAVPVTTAAPAAAPAPAPAPVVAPPVTTVAPTPAAPGMPASATPVPAAPAQK